MQSSHGNVAVPTSGTPVPFAAVSTPAYNVSIRAALANTGTVYLKGQTAATTNSPKGFPLPKGIDHYFDFIDLALLLLDVDTNNDNADFFYTTKP